MRVIIDTNVFVSGIVSQSGAPARILDAVLAGNIIPVMSEATFAELEDVLHRPKIQRYFRHADITPFSFLTVLHAIAEFKNPKKSAAFIRDEKDRPFIELAATTPKVDFIITGDKDFEGTQYENVPVVSASIFFEAIL